MEWRITDLAKHTGLSTNRIHQLANDGLFTRIKGGKSFDSVKCILAYIGKLKGKSGSAADERTRLDRLRADKIEMENAQNRKELVNLQLCQQHYINLNHAVRQKLFTIPTRVAPLCAGKTAAEIQVKVHNILNEVMRELRDPDFMKMVDDIQKEQRKQKVKRKKNA